MSNRQHDTSIHFKTLLTFSLFRATNAAGEAISMSNITVIGKRSIITDTINPQGLEKIQILEKTTVRSKTEYEYYDSNPPRFVSKLRGTTQLIEGDNAHLECQIEPINDPDLVVEILHNAQPLKTGSRFRVLSDFGYVALDIASIYPEDSGRYTVKISNRFGEVADAINIDVQGIQAIQTGTQYAETLGKLTALERGRPATRAEVEEKTAQRPVFTKPLHNALNLREGANAHLECRLIPVGDPALKVEWLKDGQPISTGSRWQLINDFGYVSLDIHKLESKDSGTYTVVATNENGQAHSSCLLEIKSEESIVTGTTNVESLQTIQYLERTKSHKLAEVEQCRFERPHFIVSLRGPSVVNENDRATLECRVLPVGDSSMTYTWYKNGQELTSSNRIACSNDFGYVVLDIASVTAEDEGIYMIRLASDCGEAMSSHQLRVNTFGTIDRHCQYPEAYRHIRHIETGRSGQVSQPERSFQGPLFTSQLNSSNVANEGEAIHLEATVEPHSDEHLIIEWYKNGNYLILGSRITATYEFGVVTLDILSAKPEDCGIYLCRLVVNCF